MDHVAEYYGRRLAALSTMLRAAPGPSRQDLATATCEGMRHRMPEPLWSTLLDAAEACVAADQIVAQFPGPAIVLYTSAINVFLRGLRDEASDEAIARAKIVLRTADVLQDPDVKTILNLARERAGFAKTSEFIRGEIRTALVADGRTEQEAETLAKRVVTASNEVRHDAQVVGLYTPTAVASDGKLTSISPQDLKKMARGKKVKVASGPILGILALPILLDEFEELTKPARLGAAFAIASRFGRVEAERSAPGNPSGAVGPG